MSSPFTNRQSLISQAPRQALCHKSIYLLICINFLRVGFLALAASSCASRPEAKGGDSGTGPLPVFETEAYKVTPANSLPFLGLSPTDVPVDVAASTLWQPFVLPIRPDLLLRERDLFVGTKGNAGGAKPEIPLGRCLLHDESTVTPRKTFRFTAAGTTQPKDREGIVFQILQSGRLLAMGSFDKDGVAECELPSDNFVVSTGYGELRTETKNIAVNPVAVNVGGRGRLRLSAMPAGLHFGDLVRVARYPSVAASDIENLFYSPIIERLEWDLVRPVSTARDNFDTHEYLSTSFLMPPSSFEIMLEPARYLVVAVRPEGKLCFANIEVKNDEVSNVTECVPSIGERQLLHPDGKTLRFDATVLPQHVTSQAEFRQWLTARAFQFFIAEAKSQVSGDSQPSPPKYVVVPNSEAAVGAIKAKAANFEPRAIDLSAAGVEDHTTEAILRLVTADASMIEEGAFSALVSKIGHGVVPFGGTSEKSVFELATPFVTLTQYDLTSPFEFDVERSFVQATNGATIDWIEPRIGNPLIVRMPPQQRFRGRVWIPPHNRTDTIEFYVNQKVYKRTIIQKPQDDHGFEFFFDEKIDERDDFDLVAVAWGSSFLPEVIYGKQGLRPFAISRPLCIDANQNGKCDLPP